MAREGGESEAAVVGPRLPTDIVGLSDEQKWAVLKHRGDFGSLSVLAADLCMRAGSVAAVARSVGVSRTIVFDVLRRGGHVLGLGVGFDGPKSGRARPADGGTRPLPLEERVALYWRAQAEARKTAADLRISVGNTLKMGRLVRFHEARVAYEMGGTLRAAGDLLGVNMMTAHLYLRHGAGLGLFSLPKARREDPDAARAAVVAAYERTGNVAAVAAGLGRKASWALRHLRVARSNGELPRNTRFRHDADSAARKTMADDRRRRAALAARDAYLREGDIHGAGRALGVSHETVRQRLLYGERSGLFAAPTGFSRSEQPHRLLGRMPPKALRRTIDVLIREADGKLWKVASDLGVSIAQLRELAERAGIGPDTLDRIRREARLAGVVKDFVAHAATLPPGESLVPSLRKSGKGMSLLARVNNNFGTPRAMCERHAPELLPRLAEKGVNRNAMTKSLYSLSPQELGNAIRGTGRTKFSEVFAALGVTAQQLYRAMRLAGVDWREAVGRTAREEKHPERGR